MSYSKSSMETRIELAPNCSLTPAGAKLFFFATCLFSLAFSMIFAVMGFWPVLPFWALEMLALGLALRASLQRRAYTQTVTITESEVRGIGRRLDFAVRERASIRAGC